MASSRHRTVRVTHAAISVIPAYESEVNNPNANMHAPEIFLPSHEEAQSDARLILAYILIASIMVSFGELCTFPDLFANKEGA